jgi:hypothetical protein
MLEDIMPMYFSKNNPVSYRTTATVEYIFCSYDCPIRPTKADKGRKRPKKAEKG